MEHSYRISFKIGDSSFEIESTDLKWLEGKEKDYFEKLYTEALKHKGKRFAEVPLDVAAPVPQGVPIADLSINEFFKKYIRQSEIKSRTTIAVFFVYYLQKVMKKGEISTADVTDCFKDVSYPNYNKLNMTDILRRGRRQALLNYVNNFWSLTTSGEDFVLNTISSKE